MKLSEIKSGLLGSMGVKGKDSAAIIRRLIVENFRVQWRRYAVAIILMMMVAGSTSASAWIISYVVNKIFIEKNLSLLVPLSLSILVLFVVKGFSNYGQEVVMGRIGNRMVAESQLRVYSHLLKFGLDYFTAKPSSHIINTVSAGAHSARDVVNTVVVSFGRDLLTLAGLAAVMIVKAPLLSVIAFVIAPIAILGMNRLVKRVRAVVLAEFGMTTRVVQLIQETVQGARVVKAFNLGPHMQAQMTDAVRGIEARANKIIRLKAGSGPLMETLGGVSICAVTLYSGWATIVGANSPGDFMSFITAFLLAYEPAKRLARLHVNLESSLVGARMMFALLATQPGKTETTGDRPLSFGAGIIEFRNVHFGYKTSRLVLKDISFRIEKNMRAALVGPSGAGKTTILTLIPRLYEVGSGSITIDGEDVRTVSAESIRQRIALVSQDTYLFDGTVRDNIRLGRLDATDPDIEKAARDAHAHDFIAALSRGYDTRIGENGVRLSGGQRQRIAIARAVIKGAPIILLDEATSSLDSESEKQVQLALDELMQGRTTIVIAHRLSTILSADKILVIDDGVVVEEGTHRDLLASSGVYQRLYNLQFGPGHVVRLGSTETIQEPVEP